MSNSDVSEAAVSYLEEDVPLYRTAHGGKLHIPPCPHVHDVELIEATEEDRATHEVSTWCGAELDGFGRTYYETVLDALRGFGALGQT